LRGPQLARSTVPAPRAAARRALAPARTPKTAFANESQTEYTAIVTPPSDAAERSAKRRKRATGFATYSNLDASQADLPWLHHGSYPSSMDDSQLPAASNVPLPGAWAPLQSLLTCLPLDQPWALSRQHCHHNLLQSRLLWYHLS
jgi:hypothetical protein